MAHRIAARLDAGFDVRVECLGYALAHDDVTGVWAGTSRQQRDAARRRGLDAETMIAELERA